MVYSDDNIEPSIPSPLFGECDVLAVRRKDDPEYAVEALLKCEHVLVQDFYSTGLTVLASLKKYLRSNYSENDFKAQREFRNVYHQASQHLLVLVTNQKLAIRKAPEIGWLSRFYPENSNLLISFPDVQGLNSAWQWYEKGILIPSLGYKLHPFYGTYFPTRFDHIELFDEWLKHYSGAKLSAIDVGVGSGVLSLQLLKHGFRHLVGTDTNPNAIIGVAEELDRMGKSSKVDLILTDLLSLCKEKTELIVFNPPWIPAQGDIAGLDSAIYYDETLFPRFFEQAYCNLEPDGHVVILFSNLAVTTGVAKNNPVEVELSNGGRFVKVKHLTRNVKEASSKTKRNQVWRATEQVELWELKKSES